MVSVLYFCHKYKLRLSSCVKVFTASDHTLPVLWCLLVQYQQGGLTHPWGHQAQVMDRIILCIKYSHLNMHQVPHLQNTHTWHSLIISNIVNGFTHQLHTLRGSIVYPPGMQIFHELRTLRGFLQI